MILARFGELHPAVLDKWNIKRIVYGFTISLPDIMIFAGAATNYKKFQNFLLRKEILRSLYRNSYQMKISKILSGRLGINIWKNYIFLIFIRENRYRPDLNLWRTD